MTLAHLLMLWFFRLVLSAIAVGLGIAAFRAFTNWLKGRKTLNWPAAAGTVISVSFSPTLVTSFGEPVSYEFNIIYDYTVGEQHYRGIRYSLFPKHLARYSKERGILENKYPSGGNVDVFYNSQSPNESVLLKGAPGKLGECLTAFLLLAATIFSIWLLVW